MQGAGHEGRAPGGGRVPGPGRDLSGAQTLAPGRGGCRPEGHTHGPLPRGSRLGSRTPLSPVGRRDGRGMSALRRRWQMSPEITHESQTLSESVAGMYRDPHKGLLKNQ